MKNVRILRESILMTAVVLTLQPVPEKDAPGVVAIYYYTPPEYMRNYTLTIQSLLNGYSTEKDGTIVVADSGMIVASNG